MPNSERGPMIENSDRGITIAKPLAWSMLIGIISAVWFGATTITGLANATDGVTRALSAMQENTAQMENRVRAVEIAQASQTSDLRSIQIGIAEIKAAVSKIGDAK